MVNHDSKRHDLDWEVESGRDFYDTSMLNDIRHTEYCIQHTAYCILHTAIVNEHVATARVMDRRCTVIELSLLFADFGNINIYSRSVDIDSRLNI